MSSLKSIFDGAYADLLKEVTPLDAADNLYPRPRNWGLYQFLPPTREEDEEAVGLAPALEAAWYCTFSDMTITIKPGDIELGPDTVIEWGDITNASETVTAADESPTWFVWVNVDISVTPPTAEMFDGATITALTTEQKLKIYQKRICKVTITNDVEDPTNDVINGITVYQCGNITIPRAAG
jgi:hypothetical protein